MNKPAQISILALALVAGIAAIVLFGMQIQKAVQAPPANPAEPGENLSQTYLDTSKGFSIRYPASYTLDENYTYQALGPGKEIPGVKFTIPLSMASGTNLSSDTYLGVETIAPTGQCAADVFLGEGAEARILLEGTIPYSFASSTGAAAGNRYEEMVYTLPGSDPCLAVRYFIHSTVLENYPAGTVRQFDRQALLEQFDAMRRTLRMQ